MQAIIAATGWQAHTVRGAMSGALGEKLGLAVTSVKEGGGGRVYRLQPNTAATFSVAVIDAPVSSQAHVPSAHIENR